MKPSEVYLINLDPTVGREIKKARPCVVLSPEVMNMRLGTVIIAPMTTTIRGYPTRVSVNFQEKEGQVALDQLRSVDKQRLVRHLGDIANGEMQSVFRVLSAIFAP